MAAVRENAGPVRGRTPFWLVAAGAAVLLAVIAVWYLTRGGPGPAPVAGSSAPGQAATSSSPSAVASAASTEPDRAAILRAAVNQALSRIAPGSVLGGAGDEFVALGVGASVQVSGMLEFDGRRGAATVRAGRGHVDLGCAGLKDCRFSVDGQGRTVRAIRYAQPVAKGEPAAVEFRVLVARPDDGSWVDISLNNAVAVYSLTHPDVYPSHTGQEPPLNQAQLTALGSDPGLDVCASGCG